MNLFRPEALEYRHADHSFGDVLLRAPTIFWVFTILLTTATTCIFIVLCTYEYTQRVPVSGKLVPDVGLAHIISQQSGVVIERKVNEGQLIERGQVLFVISTEIVNQLGESAASSLQMQASRRDSLQRDLQNLDRMSRAEQQAKRLRLDELRHESLQMANEIETQRRRLASAESTLSRYQLLEKSGFAPALQMQEKNDDLLAQRSRLQSIERSLTELNSQISASVADLEMQPMREMTQRSSLERMLSEVTQGIGETETRRRLVVVAPISGRATAIQADPGQAINPSQTLADIIPSGATLVAQLLAPSSAIGFVKSGQHVQMRYQAFPYQKFGHYSGTISEVSRSAVQSTSRDTIPTNSPMYRITVVPDKQTVLAYGREVGLQSDMAVDADVLLDRRRLIEWIFEPILALQGRL